MRGGARATGSTVKLAWMDQDYAGEPAKEAAQDGIEPQVVKLPEAKKGFILSGASSTGGRSSRRRCAETNR